MFRCIKQLLSKDAAISYGRTIALLLVISGIVDNAVLMYCRYHVVDFKIEDNDINVMLIKFIIAVIFYLITKVSDISFEKFSKIYESDTTKEIIKKVGKDSD